MPAALSPLMPTHYPYCTSITSAIGGCVQEKGVALGRREKEKSVRDDLSTGGIERGEQRWGGSEKKGVKGRGCGREEK